MALLPPAAPFPACACRVDRLAAQEARSLEAAALARIASGEYLEAASLQAMGEREQELLLFEAIKQVRSRETQRPGACFVACSRSSAHPGPQGQFSGLDKRGWIRWSRSGGEMYRFLSVVCPNQGVLRGSLQTQAFSRTGSRCENRVHMRRCVNGVRAARRSGWRRWCT